jgi:hypothetical protein
MEALRSTETVVYFYQSKRFHVPENSTVSVFSTSVYKQLNSKDQRGIQNVSVDVRGGISTAVLCGGFRKLHHEVAVPQIFCICA